MLLFWGFFKIFFNLFSSFIFGWDNEPGSGTLSKSGGKIKGSFFFTKNSSVDLIFSFLRIFPTLPAHETSKIKVI